MKDGREYSRAEMFSVSHKDSKGLYVNEEAKKKAVSASFPFILEYCKADKVHC